MPRGFSRLLSRELTDSLLGERRAMTVTTVPLSDVSILIRAAGAMMRQHDDQPARWGMYSAAAELLAKHNVGQLDLNTMPNCRMWIEQILGHSLHEQPTIEEIRERIRDVVQI